ncbi:MAG TPA: sodium ion-translocating decarboxylase subunit beta [Candidatus Competibacteraceae bacterium]|nr:sodium ion-translocating decarboxylase subunit beta [Candidatus Competibacteraceae bacterium]
MEPLDFPGLFPGIATLVASPPQLIVMRLGLIGLGFVLMYLGRKGVLEALLMIPLGLGMATINAAVLFLDDGRQGTLFVEPLLPDPAQLVNRLQLDWLQPLYTLTLSNGLIACLLLMGIGALLDVGFLMARPLQSIFIALCAELGTVVTYPLAKSMGFSAGQAAAIATIGGADGPMILFTSLILAKDLFVPITVVAYLYLALTYGSYPYLIKLLVPKSIRGLKMPAAPARSVSTAHKLVFCAVTCVLLSLLFPVAAPLFLSLFIGVIVRESGLIQFQELLSGPILYGATFFLGLLLGVLCEAKMMLNPQVLSLLLLGLLALLFSGIGGLLGGYALYFLSGRRYNPVIGIAGVSLPTTAKVAQQAAAANDPAVTILPQALGANIGGVITSAILAGIFMTILRHGVVH